MSWKETLKRSVLILLLATALPAVAHAVVQSSSSSYQVDEVFFGSGGELHACSATYCSKQASGELGVGNTASTSYQAQAGFNTNRNQYIEFMVNTSNINLGTLTPGTTATGTASFSVKTYLASGYVVVNDSPAPQNGSYTINALTSPTANNTAAEQFGMNLVANNGCGNGLPSSLGNDPVQVPSSAFSFGAAASGYNTPCQFKYVNGDTIASASKSSGETDYTISYIFNITSTTRGGTYTMSHVLVATSTY